MTTRRPSTWSIAWPAVAALACYVLASVIVPAEAGWLHSALTGMRFHVGPHREP